MAYILEHTRLGFCLLDIPAVIILVAIIAFFVIKAKKMKDEQKELEEQIAKLNADDGVKEAIGASVE